MIITMMTITMIMMTNDDHGCNDVDDDCDDSYHDNDGDFDDDDNYDNDDYHDDVVR